MAINVLTGGSGSRPLLLNAEAGLNEGSDVGHVGANIDRHHVLEDESETTLGASAVSRNF